MKKNLLLVILCVLGLFGTLRAQVLTIDGTVGEYSESTSNQVPVYNNNEYAITQQYYSAEEIGKSAGTIESIAFKTATAGTFPFTRNLTIYMVNADDYNFGVGGRTMVAMNAADAVFTGEVTFDAANTWTTIDITDFKYTGKNVLICINDATGSYISNGGSYFTTFDCIYSLPFENDYGNAYRALYKRSSSSAFDATVATTSCSTVKQTPFVQFAFAEGSTEEYQEPSDPTNVKATALNESKIQLTWDAAENTLGYNIYSGTLLLANITETSYVIKNLTPGQHCYTVKGANGPKESTGVEACTEIVAKTVESITVGSTGDDDTQTAPMAFFANDSWVEQVYSASEIGKACKIERVAFATKPLNNDATPFATQEIKIYLAETTKADYADKAWTAEADLKLVYSDTDIIIGDQEWETFELDTPFEYSGEKNLAVVVAKSSPTTAQYFWHSNNVANSVLYTTGSSYPTVEGNATNTRPVIRLSWVTDDEPITPTPTAPAAPVVTAEATSATEIVLTWEAVEGATSYNVYSGTETLATALEATTYTATGLTAETEYTFEVSAVNAAGESARATAKATTLKAVEEDEDTDNGYFATIFFYDFEKSMDGWNTIDADGDGKNWEYKTGYEGGVGDTGGLYSEAGSIETNNYIVTASKYSITSTSELSFVHFPFDVFYFSEKIAVVISEDGETFEDIWSYEYTEQPAAWTESKIDLSAYAGKDLYLGFRHCASTTAIRLDNAKLHSEEPSVPTHLAATATETTVTLTWDNVANATSYKVYSVENDTYTLLKENVTETTYTVEGLKPYTDYSYAVKSVNETKESKYSKTLTVKTLQIEGLEVLLFEDFEDFEAGDKIAEKGAAHWSTWSNKPGTAEDGVVAELNGNKCGHLTAGVDQVLLLGGYQAGVFDLEFDAYIPDGKAGYYNILHEFNGNNSVWAMQAYLQMTDNGEGSSTIAAGHGSLHAGGAAVADIPCVYDGWMHFRIHINANVNKAEYHYTMPGGEEVKAWEWKWSDDSFGETTGGRKLDAMNFFIEDSKKEYYIDNLSLTRKGGATAAVLDFDKEVVDVEMGAEDIRTIEVTVENIGTSMAEFVAWVDYGKGEASEKSGVVSYATEEISESVSIGWQAEEPLTFEIAAFYPAEAYSGSVMGTYITDAAYLLAAFVDEAGDTVPTLEPNTDMIFRIYGQGSNGYPGEVLAEKAIPYEDVILDWNLVTFDTPVALTGFDFYVAVEMTQCVGGAPMIFDGNKTSPLAGVADLCRTAKNVPFKSTKEFTAGEYNGNWHLALNCMGEPVVGGWAELDKKEGQLEIGASETLTLDITSLGLEDGENYDAKLLVKTNTNDIVELPIALYVWGENVEEILSNTYNIYPNPTTAQVVVEGENINYIAVYNSVGQLVKVVKTQNNVVDMSACENGVYFFNIVNNAGDNSVQRVVVAK